MPFHSTLDTRPKVITAMALLILVSFCPLVACTFNLSHLSECFSVDDRGLLHLLTITLALMLETTAMLIGIITTSSGKAVRFGPVWMTVSALLVWAGTASGMWLAMPSLPWYVPASLAFIAPMFTSGLGATLGVLCARLDRMAQQHAAAQGSAPSSS
ncbi:hypothetical protein MF271_21580 (plasmid) [Deinococcus sp. KNUC1210]|uniref:hypothetical protein n=1 Tax=Deinococcus sp. KNUC1210 TaxID=2917691 RepID=UPI001EF0717D|nr:hypothetical protein [Deinococcus sp. KNUC1210]ULH17863.1 hypothetical protein MF271_21580 [Deinococcus sp. KNUC1210]